MARGGPGHAEGNKPRCVSTASIQKRLKKEKKAKRKLQEALEFESKRRERVEDALKHSSSSSPFPEPLHANNNNNNGMTHHEVTLETHPSHRQGK